MSVDNFLLLLLIVSVLTGLFTEAIKTALKELNRSYYPNLLAGVVSVVLSIVVDIFYLIMTDAVFSDKMAVILIALVLLSWLASMVGYDKVIQALTQFRTHSTE
ncbi:MAG: aminopeptidase [Clostridiales bacterium]|nr:aminopeptidase [Clostridiales bacterium]